MESTNRMILIIVFSLFAAATLVSMSAMSISSALLILVLLWMGFRWNEQQSSHQIFYRTGFDWLLIVWPFVTLIGYLLHEFTDFNWVLKVTDFSWIIVFYAIISALIYLRPIDKVVTPVSGFVIFCSLYAIVISIMGFDPVKGVDAFAHSFEGTFRTGGFFSNPMTFAHVYGLYFCLLFGVFLYFFKWKDQRSWFLILAVVLTGVALLLSFTRGVWISLGITVPIMGFFYRKRLGLGLIALLAGSFLILNTFWPSFNERVHKTINWEQSYDTERVAIWQTHWAIFKDAPAFGVGYGQNVKLVPEYLEKLGLPKETLVSHAHNQFLHFLAGTGVVGITLYLIIILLFLRLTLKVFFIIPDRDYFEKGLALGAFGSQIAFQIGGLTEANFEHMKVKYVLCFIWAIVVWLAYEYRILRR
jgi:O-antigen ligase